MAGRGVEVQRSLDRNIHFRILLRIHHRRNWDSKIRGRTPEICPSHNQLSLLLFLFPLPPLVSYHLLSWDPTGADGLTGRTKVVQHLIRADLGVDGFDCGCHVGIEISGEKGKKERNKVEEEGELGCGDQVQVVESDGMFRSEFRFR